MEDPPELVVRRLWQRWPAHASIDEFSRIEEIKGQRGTNVLTSAKSRRRTVAAALPDCPPGGWITVDELFAAMQRGGLEPTVARSERALWRLYLGDPQYGSLGYLGHHDWPVVEGRYVLAVLFEYVGTLGLFDLEYVAPAGARDDFTRMWGADWINALSRYDGLRAVRLNALGAYVLGLTDAYQAPAQPEPECSLEILANLGIVATGELPSADRSVLDAHAARTSERVWALSTTTLLSAVDSGRQLADFPSFLEDRAAHPLPDSVRVLVDDVCSRVGQVRDLGLRRVVECAEPSVVTAATNRGCGQAHTPLYRPALGTVMPRYTASHVDAQHHAVTPQGSRASGQGRRGHA